MLAAVSLSFFRGDLGTWSDALSSSVALPPVSVSVSLSRRSWRALRRALRALRRALRLALRCFADNFDLPLLLSDLPPLLSDLPLLSDDLPFFRAGVEPRSASAAR